MTTPESGAVSPTPQPAPEPTGTPAPTPTPTAPVPARPRQSRWLLPLSLLVIAVLVFGGLGATYYVIQNRNTPPNYLVAIGAAMTTPYKLDESFTDADGDMVADAPKDATKLFKPAKLIFAPLTSNLAREKEIWKDFTKHLENEVKLPVEMEAKDFNSLEEIGTLKNADQHLLALSTGTVPWAVNIGGFVPLYVMSDKDGKFGFQVEFIVPANSTIKSLKDIKGKQVTLGSMRSQSAFKAPIYALYQQEKLLLGRDYVCSLGSRQDLAIKAIAKGEATIAPVASDLLARMIAQEDITSSSVRTVQKLDDRFPPMCYGVPHNLHPEIVSKIKKAFDTFKFEGTSMEKPFAAANQTKFIPISYKKDWEVVRKADDAMSELVKAK